MDTLMQDNRSTNEALQHSSSALVGVHLNSSHSDDSTCSASPPSSSSDEDEAAASKRKKRAKLPRTGGRAAATTAAPPVNEGVMFKVAEYTHLVSHLAYPGHRNQVRTVEDWGSSEKGIMLQRSLHSGDVRLVARGGGYNSTKSRPIKQLFFENLQHPLPLDECTKVNSMLLDACQRGTLGIFCIVVEFVAEQKAVRFTLGVLHTAVVPQSVLNSGIPVPNDLAFRNQVMTLASLSPCKPTSMLSESKGPLSNDVINARLQSSMEPAAIAAASLPELKVVEQEIQPLLSTKLKKGQQHQLAHLLHRRDHAPTDVLTLPGSWRFNDISPSLYYNSCLGAFTADEIQLSLSAIRQPITLMGDHTGRGKTLTALSLALHCQADGPHIVLCHDNPHHWVNEIHHLSPHAQAAFPVGVYAPAGFEHIMPDVAMSMPNVLWIKEVEEIAKHNIRLVITTWGVLKADRARWNKANNANARYEAHRVREPSKRKRSSAAPVAAELVPEVASSSSPLVVPLLKLTLFDVDFGIALGDETQRIDVDRHHLALSSAASRLRSRMRVALTGTSAHAEKPSVMYEIFQFLGLPILSQYFGAFVATPLSQAVRCGLSPSRHQVTLFLESIFCAIGFRHSAESAMRDLDCQVRQHPLVAVSLRPWELVEMATMHERRGTSPQSLEAEVLMAYHPGVSYKDHTPAHVMQSAHRRLSNTETRVVIRLAELMCHKGEALLGTPVEATRCYQELDALLAKERNISWSTSFQIRFHHGYGRALTAAHHPDQAAVQDRLAEQLRLDAIQQLRETYTRRLADVIAQRGRVAQWPAAFLKVLGAVQASGPMLVQLFEAYNASAGEALAGSSNAKQLHFAMQSLPTLAERFDQLVDLLQTFADPSHWTRDALVSFSQAACHEIATVSWSRVIPQANGADQACLCATERLVSELRVKASIPSMLVFRALASVVKKNPDLLVGLGVLASDFAAIPSQLSVVTKEINGVLHLLIDRTQEVCVALCQALALVQSPAVAVGVSDLTGGESETAIRAQHHKLDQTRALMALLDQDLHCENKPLTSSKILACADLALKLRVEYPRDKIVVFVPSPLMAKLTYDYFQTRSLGSDCLLDTSAHVEDTLRLFRRPDSPPILLSTFARLSTGHNIVEANHVILASGYHLDSEIRQAIARLVRYGQTKDVHVHRLIGLNTIDQNMAFGLPAGAAGAELKAALQMPPIHPAIALWNISVDGQPRFRSSIDPAVFEVQASGNGESPAAAAASSASAVGLDLLTNDPLGNLATLLSLPVVQRALLDGGLQSSHVERALQLGREVQADLPRGLLAQLLRHWGRTTRALGTSRSGDCMFDAVVDQLSIGTPQDRSLLLFSDRLTFERLRSQQSLLLRGRVADALQGPLVHLQAFLHPDLQGGAIRQPAVWGDHTCLRVLASVLRRHIMVLSTLNPRLPFKVSPAEEEMEALAEANNAETLWIAHSAENHYWSITR